MKFFQMLKGIIFIGVIFVGVFSNRLKSRLGFTKEECEAKGGKFCPGQEYRECYIYLNETVSTYEEAEDLCAKKEAMLPYFSFKDYSNFLNCTEFPWPHPFKVFLQNSLPTSDKCLDTTFIDVSELISDTRCSLDDKINVICEIPF
ncbi:UNVERIFIED_CONTAM: hypothetical protein RMT77_008641 [Armadillidium vulgare]